MKFTKTTIFLIITLVFLFEQVSNSSRNLEKKKNKNLKIKKAKSKSRRDDPSPADAAAPATPPADGAAATASADTVTNTATGVCCEKKTGNVTVKSTKKTKEECDGTILPLSSCSISFPRLRFPTFSYFNRPILLNSPMRYVSSPGAVKMRKQEKNKIKKSKKKGNKN